MARSLQQEWDAAKPADTSLQALWDSAAPKEPPSYPAVVGNALNKFIAGTADLPAYVGSKLWNFGANVLTNHPEASVEAPQHARQGMEALNLIRPEAEPQTTGQRITDRAVQGAAGLALTPAKSLTQAAVNAGLGLLSGGAGGVTKEVTGSEPLATAVSMATPIVAQAAGQYGREKIAEAMSRREANAVKDATLAEARKAGYVVPPSMVNPTGLNNKLESIAGKAAVKQDAAARNQEITNVLANKSLGLPENTALTEAKLADVRKDAGKVYAEVDKLRPTPDMPWFPRFHETDLVEQLKQARKDANEAYKHFRISGDPKVRDTAERFAATADSIEGDLASIAAANKRPDLVKALADARTKIAKTYDVEKALNVGDAGVSAPMIGAMLNKDRPLTGELKTVGKFAEAFPAITREGAKVPVAGVSGTDAASSALLGTLGYGAAGGPAGILAAGLPLLRSPARHLVLSDFYQNHMLTPTHGAGQVQRMLGKIPEGNAALQSALLAVIAARQQGKE